jgi:ankyrin repeat protein
MLSGETSCVDALIAKGADVSRIYGVQSALTFAITANDEIMVQRVVAAGAKVNDMQLTSATEFPLPPLFFALSLDTYAQACELHRYLHTLREMQGFAYKHADQLLQAAFGGDEVDDDAFVREMMDKMQNNPAGDAKAGEEIADDDVRVTRAMKMFDSRVNLALVRTLVTAGADPSLRFGFNGVSSIHNLIAATTQENEAHMCEVLTTVCESLSEDARVKVMNQRSAGGDSLMSLAIMHGTADIAKTMLKLGFDPNAYDNVSFTPNSSPLPAAAADEPNVTRVFAVAGMVPPRPLADAETAPGLYIQPACQVLHPLLQAIRDNNAAMVEVLIDAGVTVHCESDNSDLIIAAQTAGEAIVRELATAIRDTGASVSVQDAQGNTALHHALMRAPSTAADKVVGALIQAKADISIANAEGMMPVHLAAASKRDHSLELILKAAPDATAAAMAATPDGLTALAFAVSGGSSSTTEVLLKAGVDPNAAVMGPMPAIILAVHHGFEAVVKTLLAHGADAKAEVEGVSALVLAEMRGNTALVALMTKDTEVAVADQ